MPGDVLDSFLGPDQRVDSHVRIVPDSILPSALARLSRGVAGLPQRLVRRDRLNGASLL